MLVVLSGCAQRTSTGLASAVPRVVVVAPVLNLSGSNDFDSLKVTDLIASEFLSFPGIVVVPVNRALAELASRGKSAVETPDDAVELARAVGADATIVAAITEYDPYDPPVVGLVLQWYAAERPAAVSGLDPVQASRAAAAASAGPAFEDDVRVPRWQVQRVFRGADEDVLKDVRAYAAERDDGGSPYGWRLHLQSQELWLRYASRALIRTILLLEQSYRVAVEPNEAHT